MVYFFETKKKNLLKDKAIKQSLDLYLLYRDIRKMNRWTATVFAVTNDENSASSKH